VGELFNTHVKAVRDFVIITNNGKSEAVVIPYEHFANYQDSLHIQYINEKLAEAEAIENDPNNWLTMDEVMENINKWRQQREI
jgi:PHD/YefM family antitoxin component YafN of YafNO toxin-antitoxin module